MNEEGKVSEEDSSVALATSTLTLADNLRKQRLALLNMQPGTKTKVSGKYVYLTSPRILTRLFGAPLPAPNGDPFKLRVTSGWGSPRTTAGTGESRIHHGLDFSAAVGTEVYASYSGVVEFTGATLKNPTGRQEIILGYVDNIDGTDPKRTIVKGAGSIYFHDEKSGQEKIAVDISRLSNSGLFVKVRHGGEFDGYTTDYMHLSKVVVKKGQVVNEGQLLGYTGRTGGTHGIVPPHLHWQARYNNTPVKPEGLVPSTKFKENQTGYKAEIISFYRDTTSIGLAAIADNNINALTTADRSVSAANQSRASLKKKEASYLQRLEDGFRALATNTSQAITALTVSTNNINNPMVFDFTTGLWSDGKVV